MFGLGFKKNEEKDILIRTITELQELRAELSVLKDRLFLIIPDQARENSPAELVAEAEGMAECCGDPPLSLAQPESPGDISAEPATPDEVSETAAQEEQPEIINPEMNIPNDNTAEESLLRHGNESGVDPVGGEIPGPENAVAKKEWAVVSFVEAKRPWWRLWGPKDHLVRRSI